MKKSLYILMVIVFVTFCLSVFFVNNNSRKTFVQDGIQFAVKVDGIYQNSFPNETDNYYVDINCTNAHGQWRRIQNQNDTNFEYKLIIDNITGNVACDVDFLSIDLTDKDNIYFLSNVVKENADDLTESGYGYRYKGMNPNNYLWFNNELWRIIGLVPTVTELDENDEVLTTEDLVKIIRDNTLGSLAYDAKTSGYTGIWGDNTLYHLLNEYYWGKLDGTIINTTMAQYCFSYHDKVKGKCDYRSIGLLSTDFYGAMVENVYWNTGLSANANSIDTTYQNEISNQTVSGYVGLMNASDYLLSKGSTYGRWLYKYEFEYSCNAATSTSVLHVFNGDSMTQYGSGYARAGENVRPVVYLSSDVYVVAGSGTEADPYQINMLSGNSNA